MATIREVMSTELVAVAPHATIAEAATVMGTRHVGAALVMDGDRLAGIFTERDILRALASNFDAAEHLVSHWMTENPTTLPPGADASEALRLMLGGGFRHVPVVDEDLVVGIVSMRDVAPFG
jgi:CBS domain-containing protein